MLHKTWPERTNGFTGRLSLYRHRLSIHWRSTWLNSTHDTKANQLHLPPHRPTTFNSCSSIAGIDLWYVDAIACRHSSKVLEIHKFVRLPRYHIGMPRSAKGYTALAYLYGINLSPFRLSMAHAKCKRFTMAWQGFSGRPNPIYYKNKCCGVRGWENFLDATRATSANRNGCIFNTTLMPN